MRSRARLLAPAIVLLHSLLAPGRLAAAPGWVNAIVRDPGDGAGDPASPATLLSHDTEVEFRGDGKTKIRVRKALRINLPEGLEHAVLIERVAPQRKVDNVRGWRWDGEHMVELSPDAIIEAGQSISAGIYSDDRALVATFPEAEPGNIIAYEYRIEDRDISHLTQALLFPEPCDARSISVRMKAPEGWIIAGQSTHADEWNESFDEGRKVLVGRNWRAIPRDPALPPSAPGRRILWIACHDPAAESGHHSDWASVGREVMETYEAASEPGEEVRARAELLTRDLGTQASKVDALCRFVQADIRYVGVEIGKGRWIPRSCETSLHNLYADCKDKTVLLRAMLRVIGVRSSPALVNAGPRVLRDVPTPYQFNHCILAIDAADCPDRIPGEAVVDGWVLFDPTDPWTPFGSVPAYLARNLVLVAEDPEVLREVEARSWLQRARSCRAAAGITEDGRLQARVLIEETGSLGREGAERAARMGSEELVRELQEQFRSTVEDPEIRDLRFETRADTCRTTFVLSGRKTVSEGAKVAAINPFLFPLPDVPTLPPRPRTYPILLGDPLLLQVQVTWKLPADWRWEAPGTVAEATMEGARFRLSAEGTADASTWGWTYQQEDVELAPDRLDEVQTFSRSLRQARETPLLFARGDP